jgi:hypothetical protein
MPRVELTSLPDHGRIWVFPAGRRLEEEEARTLLAEVDEFLDGWAAHGSPLRSARQLRDRQFLVVAVDEDVESPSGCSIDALVHRLKELGRKLEVTLVEHGPVWFRAGGDVRTVSRSEFRRMARDGEVDVRTPVFDTSLTRLSVLRAHGLERPAADSWHGRAFFGAPKPA